ncbi:MAG: polyisoprenyl-phosphate glycosyltransferase [Candidatus Eremiobacteraeota bacterium]|nr:polyisoprenyl-phosphate glycosyltransferase [Candidatus Eremiobacteraeota bacterium]MEA2720600.1 polyisoprenyl-phosphate glycosyltransferase [Candidatus Eremiobacteraeota bacterium]
MRRGADATLSVVVPLFNEANNIDELLRRIRNVIHGLSVAPAAYEMILVDDGSRDATLEKLLGAAHADPRVRVISLSRNFGHQIAATAGLDAARGDAVVLMDGDLQDPPELIDDFLAKFRDGYDVVYATRRRRRGESRFKLFTAALFYRIIRRLTNVSIPVDTGDFRLMSRRVVAALRDSRERHRFIRGLVSWVGYKQTGIEYDRAERFSGESKYPVSKMLKFAIDGITAFSEIPLRLATWFGFIVSAVAFVVGLVEIGIKIFTGYNLPGYTSTIFAILFLGGVQLITIGILGEYVGRVYDEIKGRPLYLVADNVGSGLDAPSDSEPSTAPVTR